MKAIMALMILLTIILISCQKDIGGDKDDHGCLIGAGYSWDEDADACIRSWELDEDEKRASKVLSNEIEDNMTILQIDRAFCRGCYSIKAKYNSNDTIITATLKEWKVISIR